MEREGTVENSLNIVQDCHRRSGPAIEAMNWATFDLAPHLIFPCRELHRLNMHDVSSVPDRLPRCDVVTGDSARLSATPVCRNNALASNINRESGIAVVYRCELC